MKDVTRASIFKPAQRSMRFNARWLYIPFILVILLYYYIVLPPIHYASMAFWMFLLIITAGILVIELLNDSLQVVKKASWGQYRQAFKQLSWKYRLLILPWPIILVVGIVSNLIFSPFFMSNKYANMIDVHQEDFAEDFPETDVSQIPLVDRDTAVRLGNRQLGNLTELVSQFVPSPDYTQININSHPYRVTPLEYAGFFRWVNNFKKGIPHYLQIDNVTGEVQLKTPEQPIRYSYSELLNRNFLRHLRFNYPFTLFNAPAFEVDDEGTPYYIASTYGRNFFLREPEVTGVITVNAMTGETQHYPLESIPTWIDRVYPANLIIHQLTMRGHYSNGFFNYYFAQNGVTEPTEGYNYLPMDDDLYLYTGITSVVADDSNIGFMLVNLRTKDATFYPLSAAEEFSTMDSAEGSVQEKEYKATFPLLINIEGRPLYILTLKDQSGLIKAYALIDAQNYQKVYVESSVNKLMQTYVLENSIEVEEIEFEDGDLNHVEGLIQSIQAAVVDGNTMYYFTIDGKIYKANIKLADFLPFLEEGQSISIFTTEDGMVQKIETEASGE